ncbi:MAG TPA: MFS transporter [Candidatus Bathyarchaeia archaeon]|nr:MFS transporter [Candidatus Bathyarchaeia archaeon]
MAEREDRDQQEKISASGLSPFRYSLYRAFWMAALFSYIGAAMYDVAASWLMTSLAPNALFVSLVTTASTLPIFLFALPSGALSDIFDRRNILLVTCGYMFTLSITLGVLALLHVTTPALLLIFTFALGAGTTMIRTPIIPTMSALVSRSELPAALTLSAVASNIGRAVGPTVAGFIVTAIAPWAVFFLTSASYIVMIIVLSKLSRKSQVQTSLPPENIIGAIRAQIRYVRYSQAAHVLIARAGLFTLCSSALLSLLPLLARHVIGLDSTGFGLLLGSFGTGAIIGGIAILPKLRPRVSIESLITGSIGLLVVVIFTMGYIRDFGILCIVMGAGGVAYITIFSQLYTIGMKSAPKWIGARVLAVYLLILNGGLAVGSVIWGIIANTIGIPITLSIASLALAATIITRKRYSTTLVDDLDFTPAGSDHWSLPPQLSIDPANSEGQALVTIDYKIDPKLSEEFEELVLELGTILKSEGMVYWKLFQDPADIGHYLEIRIADTWTDHMRQHERVTKNVKLLEDRIRALVKDCPTPIVSHYIAKPTSK